VPSSAAAYAFNVTAVPMQNHLGYLTMWPTGVTIPNVSTLNSYLGTVVANMAVVPAGTGGAASIYVTDPSDLLFDVNGYFAPGGGLHFYPMTPCRVADTRQGAGMSGAFGPPTMGAGVQRSFPVPQSSCGIPSTAQAYSLNVTVKPQGYLGFLSIWPTGVALPIVSTLNSYLGAVVANGAIVPVGTNGRSACM
jgi:hypothetical protein